MKNFKIINKTFILIFVFIFINNQKSFSVAPDNDIYMVDQKWNFSTVQRDLKITKLKELADLYGALGIDKQQALLWQKRSKAEINKEIALRKSQISLKFVKNSKK